MSLVRMQASPLAEVREYGVLMLGELRKIIPSFLTRVDLEDRGVRWASYLSDVRNDLEVQGAALGDPNDQGASVTLTDWDEDAEVKLVAAALYAASELSDIQLQQIARDMTPTQRAEVVAAMVGDRSNRRHKPGRAMERTSYRFDVKCDIGAFRDLQRHRLMTLEWQKYSTRLGYDLPNEVVSQGFGDRWTDIMDQAGELYEDVRDSLGADVAQYVVPFAFNIRFVMEMNPRQAFHLIELRSQSAGHPAYRSRTADASINPRSGGSPSHRRRHEVRRLHRHRPGASRGRAKSSKEARSTSQLRLRRCTHVRITFALWLIST